MWVKGELKLGLQCISLDTFSRLLFHHSVLFLFRSPIHLQCIFYPPPCVLWCVWVMGYTLTWLVKLDGGMFSKLKLISHLFVYFWFSPKWYILSCVLVTHKKSKLKTKPRETKKKKKNIGNNRVTFLFWSMRQCHLVDFF